jgi:hypothetical protein
MSSIYRPNVNGSFNGPLTTIPDNLSVDQVASPSSSCSGCTSIYETMKYRSDFDKVFVPTYQARLALFDTNPLNLKFER